MSVNIGEVQTFENVKADKAQVLKVLEEAAEVFGAWQRWAAVDISSLDYHRNRSYDLCPEYRYLLDECADVIQATCNLLSALGVDDMSGAMTRCKARNVARGRM